MNDKFYEQKKEKQDIMINGAMQVFAYNGYAHSSTDDMVRMSGVSKGLWFHYFDNKKGLYSFVVNYAVKYIILEYSINVTNSDFYDIILDMEAVKIKLMDKYPFLPLLIWRLPEDMNSQMEDVATEAYKTYCNTIDSYFDKADYSKFIDEVNTKNIRNMLDATLGQIMRRYYNDAYFSRQLYLTEIEQYVNMLRTITYKDVLE